MTRLSIRLLLGIIPHPKIIPHGVRILGASMSVPHADIMYLHKEPSSGLSIVEIAIQIIVGFPSPPHISLGIFFDQKF